MQFIISSEQKEQGKKFVLYFHGISKTEKTFSPQLPDKTQKYSQ